MEDKLIKKLSHDNHIQVELQNDIWFTGRAESISTRVLWEVSVRNMLCGGGGRSGGGGNDNIIRAVLWTITSSHPAIYSGIIGEWSIILEELSQQSSILSSIGNTIFTPLLQNNNTTTKNNNNNNSSSNTTTNKDDNNNINTTTANNNDNSNSSGDNNYTNTPQYTTSLYLHSNTDPLPVLSRDITIFGSVLQRFSQIGYSLVYGLTGKCSSSGSSSGDSGGGGCSVV